MAVRCSESKLHQKVAKLWLDLGGIFIRVEHGSTQRISNCKNWKIKFYLFVKSKICSHLCAFAVENLSSFCARAASDYLKPFIDFSEIVEIKEAFLGEKIIIVIFLKRKLQQFTLVFKESEFQFLMFYPLAIPR